MFKGLINRLCFGLTITGVNVINLNQSSVKTDHKNSLFNFVIFKGIVYAISYPFSPLLIFYDLGNYHYNHNNKPLKNFKYHFYLGSKYLVINDKNVIWNEECEWGRWE